MSEPPLTLDGARTLQWAVVPDGPESPTVHTVDGVLVERPVALVVAAYDDDSERYLFYCDADWNVMTDTCHSSLALAHKQAEFEYPGVRFRDLGGP